MQKRKNFVKTNENTLTTKSKLKTAIKHCALGSGFTKLCDIGGRIYAIKQQYSHNGRSKSTADPLLSCRSQGREELKPLLFSTSALDGERDKRHFPTAFYPGKGHPVHTVQE
jgi:hypothetical protein